MNWLKNILQIFVSSFWARIYGFVYRVAYAPIRGWQFSWRGFRPSWAAGVGCATLVVLSAIAFGVFLWMWLGGPPKDLPRWASSWWVLILLVLSISLAAYATARLWQPGEERFEDIEVAWHAGLAELAQHGISLQQVPLFLVFGADSNDQVKRLFRASGFEFAVEHAPPGTNALHWYANKDVAFLVCSQVGCLTHVAREAFQKLLEARSSLPAQESRPGPQPDLFSTAWPTEDAVAGEPSAEPAEREARVPVGPAQSPWDTAMPESDPGTALPAADGESARPIHLGLNRVQLDLETRRLACLGRLLVTTRRPYAPANGAVTLLPHNMVLSDHSEGATIREAVRADLGTMVRTLQLRFPVFAVVTGWEGDEGFHELVRRLGPDLPRTKKFGKGSELWAPPLPSRLAAVSHHACGAFEDFIYHLFKQADATKRTTNRLLLGLLCKIRRYLSPRLIDLIAEGYSCREDESGLAEVPLFGGCYFVAAGREPATQAFVRGLFHSIAESHAELEWTPAALREDAWHWRAAGVGCATALICVVFSVLTLYGWFRSSW